MSKALFRNLIIIAVLLVAIFQVYQRYEAKQQRLADRQAENARIAEEAKKRTELQREEARLDRSAAGGGGLGKAPERNKKTQAERLAELSVGLKSGDRSAFPRGTQQLGESWFLVVKQPMSWTEAWGFAAEHGARLAVIETQEVLQMLSLQLKDKDPAWIGAGDCGGGKFRWVDGSRWQGDDQLQGVNRMVALSELGIYQSRDARDQLPVVLEWTAEKAPAGSILAISEQFDAAMDPPLVGTVEVGKQRYAVIPRKSTWLEARELAERMGGSLAVPGGETEARLLLKVVRYRLLDGGAVWIGAKAEEGAWRWITGETEVAVESVKAESDMALVVKMDGSKAVLNAVRESEALDYFLVEWGGEKAKADPRLQQNGSENSSKKQQASPAEITAVKELRLKARGAAGKILVERDKALKTNTKDLAFDMRNWFRGLGSNDKDEFSISVNAVLARLEGKEIPQRVDGVNLPERAAAMYENHLRAQVRHRAEGAEKMEKLRVAYLGRLEQMKVEAVSQKRAAFERLLTQEISKAGSNADDFERYIGR